MSGDGSLGSWSQDIINSSTHHRAYDGISDEESLEVFMGDEIHG